jgi:hypothetical protein
MVLSGVVLVSRATSSGPAVGAGVGALVGAVVGAGVGAVVGAVVGAMVGASVGPGPGLVELSPPQAVSSNIAVKARCCFIRSFLSFAIMLALLHGLNQMDENHRRQAPGAGGIS